MKRKDGITHDTFRDHFENSHAKLGREYLGHLFVDYKRHYITGTAGGGVPTDPKGSQLEVAPLSWEHDAEVEWVMPNEAAFEEILRSFADPVIGKAFYDDEWRPVRSDATSSCSDGIRQRKL